LVQSSAPTSPPNSSRATPVSHFESLTPDLRDSDDEWDYKDIEGIESDSDNCLTSFCSDENILPNPISNSIPILKAPEQGQSIPLNGALNIPNNIGDNDDNKYHLNDENVKNLGLTLISMLIVCPMTIRRHQKMITTISYINQC
jgi:hypothetical protein